MRCICMSAADPTPTARPERTKNSRSPPEPANPICDTQTNSQTLPRYRDTPTPITARPKISTGDRSSANDLRASWSLPPDALPQPNPHLSLTNRDGQRAFHFFVKEFTSNVGISCPLNCGYLDKHRGHRIVWQTKLNSFAKNWGLRILPS